MASIFDLIKDEKTGKLSHTKIGSIVGITAMTAAFLHRAFYANVADFEFEMLVYGIIVTAPNMLGKFLNMRFGGMDFQRNNQQQYNQTNYNQNYNDNRNQNNIDNPDEQYNQRKD